MKDISLLSFLLLSVVTLAQVPDQKKHPSFIEDIAKLPKVERRKWGQDLQRATQLFQEKKVKECLATIKSLNERIPTNPAVHNLAGACHVENRDFKKASESFRLTLLYAPDNLNTTFNLAEVEFVTKDYKTARTSFEKVRHGFEEQGPAGASMEVYCQFKIFLCSLMLGDKEKIKKVADTFERDRPKELVHFYSQAALSIHGKDLKTAKMWLEDSKKFVPLDQHHANYRDALTEIGYLDKKQNLILPE